MGVRTRYAPSPTGALHIGGARTALFNWAFARHSGGSFFLRFEDTDRVRSTPDSERAILEAFEWLGLDFDRLPGPSGIPRQSERGARYRSSVEDLIGQGHAYRCTCTQDQVEEMRRRARELGRTARYEGICRDRGLGPDPGLPFCVRLRVPETGQTRWTDLIAGASGEDISQLDDFVIARTDGTPIYHLAVVVDDHEMEITHVIRGREHMSSTPRQLLLYQALGLSPPQFAHVPLLVDASGKKLSKRVESVSVQSYRARGFTPEAVLNFIARLGWGHGDTEVFSLRELAELFTLDGVGKSASQVNEDKLLWLSQHYIKEMPSEALLAHLGPFLDAAAGRPVEIDAALARLVELLRERSKTLEEMAARARFACVDDVELDPKAARKLLRKEAREPLADLRSALAALSEWTEDSVHQALQGVVEQRGLSLGKLAQPTRVAIVGSAASPGIFETLEIVGRDRSLARLDAALSYIDRRSD